MCNYCYNLNIQNSDNDFKSLPQELRDFLIDLFGKGADKLPELHPYLMMWIEKQLKENDMLSHFSRDSFKQSIQDNIYNFSIAKSNHFLRNLRSIKRTEDEKKVKKLSENLASLMFVHQQNVENYQVKHLTESINKTEKNPEQLLIYLSENDGRVRDWHIQLHGTVRPASDTSFWNLAFRALQSWNCRCEIEEAEDGEQLTGVPSVKVPRDMTEPSNIDLEKGKAILFDQKLPVFEQASPVVRREFRPSGF